MKFNSVLVLGLVVWFLNIEAADPDQEKKVRIVNNTGSQIELRVTTQDPSGSKASEEQIVDQETYLGSNTVGLGVRFAYKGGGSWVWS